MTRRALPILLLFVASVALRAATVPRPAPEFAVEMPAGKKLFLHDYKEKVCLIAFISTTCPHCQKLVGVLSQINAEYAPKGVKIVASAFNEGAMGALPLFIATYKPNFPVGFNTAMAVYSFMQIPVMSNGGFVPKLAFIDKSGVIRAQYEGENAFFTNEAQIPANIKAELDKLLNEPAHSSGKKAVVKKTAAAKK